MIAEIILFLCESSEIYICLESEFSELEHEDDTYASKWKNI